MISWSSIFLLVLVCMLTIVVIRLSEISTRMHTLETAAEAIAKDNQCIMESHVTRAEFDLLLRVAGKQ